MNLKTLGWMIADHLEITENLFWIFYARFCNYYSGKSWWYAHRNWPAFIWKTWKLKESQQDIEKMSPIMLLNLAWDKFYTDQGNYNLMGKQGNTKMVKLEKMGKFL